MSCEARRHVRCSNCDRDLDPDHARMVDQPCPHCGSKELSIEVHVEDRMELREMFCYKIKDPAFNSKHNPRREFKSGDVLSADGKCRHHERLIDKENDKYVEVVKDRATGEVVHQCKEPLTAHRGHGSAKPR